MTFGKDFVPSEELEMNHKVIILCCRPILIIKVFATLLLPKKVIADLGRCFFIINNFFIKPLNH